jgi:anti-anti-sigma factor
MHDFQRCRGIEFAFLCRRCLFSQRLIRYFACAGPAGEFGSSSRNRNFEGKITMSTIATQIWKGSRFTVKRAESETHGTVFRFSGPFTARDMYNSLSPDAFRNIFESVPGDGQPPAHILDLTEVPYMDSTGLGMLTSHYVRCQSKGIRLSITGVSPRVRELLRITRMENVLPIAAIQR